MTTTTESTFDPRDFRRALGKFPTGVTIISTRDDEGKPVAMTASSFNSVSVDPPLILWSIDKGSLSTPVFTAAKHFAVNVLSKSQIDMSNRFAGRGQDKFSGVEFSDDAKGSPLFSDCAAQFECETWEVYEGGDHYIVVGKVVDYRHFEEQSPLVFAGGSYAVPMQHPSTVDNQFLKTPGKSFLGDYLLYLLRVAYTKLAATLYPELQARFSISAEQWRVLTLLANVAEIEAQELARQVGQPIGELKATVDIMQSRGLAALVDDKVRLTEEGSDLAEQVFSAARAQEAEMVSALSEQQRLDLKSSLKQITDSI